ncbi:alpha-amylase family glycosyl hydrolase [Dongia soli]|uniref:Alpha-amylase family glycosyl hydrolase n=1 Tax=Dongia soli TaxID=600628 RepID=A0ABU5EFF7_9PROT|nr:alpha-amylase family glycosyl hydrolase [Dongia soli]MDY0885149.1 alpha-amylase family glycosyl hydrolase [Dongia soli]
MSAGASPAARLSHLSRYPSLIEVNARPWLSRLSLKAGKPLTLAEVDEATLDAFSHQGFDWVWLLGVWQIGLASRTLSRRNPAWRREFQSALPDLSEEDICGSCFAIGAYEVDEALGGKAALADFRARLAARGIRLMLDFVPNHTALDHRWVKERPDFYIEGSEEALAVAPQNYCRVETHQGARIFAHGRDPNFPGWPDTLQLNYANPALQVAQMAELASIAEQCDGLRCDMSMLLLPEVFQRSWNVTPPPFWPKALAGVRQAHPRFTFLAEAYWNLEWELQQQGFDYCYDKRLYDRLRTADGTAIRAHLAAGLDYQDRLARFLENHDEPRAAATFPWPRHQAAAIITFLAPGFRFFHQGQLDGARIHLPVHLCRGAPERPYPEILRFYERLMTVLSERAVLRDGRWSLIPPEPAWAGNPTWQDFIAYAWHAADGGHCLAIVNYSDHQAQCRLRLPFAAQAGNRFRLTDVMGGEVYDRDGSGMLDPGLYIDLGPWRYNLFAMEPVSP